MLEQEAVLERLMPALDFALGRRMVGRSADMLDVLVVQPVGKIARDISRAVIRQQQRSVNDGHLIKPRGANERSSVAVTSFEATRACRSSTA
jgi:hypothetical protein